MHVNNCHTCTLNAAQLRRKTLKLLCCKFTKISSESAEFYIRCNKNILVFLWFILHKLRSSTSIGMQEFI